MDENGPQPVEPTISDYNPEFAGTETPEYSQSYAPVEPEVPWADVLSKIPDQYRGELNPALEEYTQRVTQEWEPYNFLRENAIDPDTVQYAMNILYTLNNDPRQLYDALGQYYKFAQTQADQPEFEEAFSDEQQADPRIERLEQGLQTMARLLLEAREQQEAQEQDALLSQELDEARQKYGDFDENYVLGLALNGASIENAVRQFKSLEQRIAGGNVRSSQPVIMGSGGGAPGSNIVDPRKLSSNETKNLVAQMLEQASRS